MENNRASRSFRVSPEQQSSALMQAIAIAWNLDEAEQSDMTVPLAHLHFHDDSSVPIAWNDAQAIEYFNRYFNASLEIPLTATEGYNQHHHTGPYDGGYIGMQLHDHRDNHNGGFSFAVYSPGTSLPQQSWAI